MTQIDLNCWSAEKVMGWSLFEDVDPLYQGKVFKMPSGQLRITIADLGPTYPESWTPLTDYNQLFMVIEKMRELKYQQFHVHWNKYLLNGKGSYVAYFGKSDDEIGHAYNPDPSTAVLMAAREALEKMELL